MTTQSGTILANKLNPLSTTLNVAPSSTSLTIGSTFTTTTINRINDVKVAKPKVYVWNASIVSPTVDDFLANGTVICSIYSTANPSTSNDIITVNLPTPTEKLEGMIFFFKKLRGSANSASNNWVFNCSSYSIVDITATITTTGQPRTTYAQIGTIIRMLVCGYEGSYYWTFI